MPTGSPLDGLLPFNDYDTLENIRATIKHNGFRFQVGHNWAYDEYGYAATQADVRPCDVTRIVIPPAPAPPDPELPAKFDLRDINGRSYIGPIRDQAETVLCQSFAVAAAAEASYNRRNGLYDDNCISLSPMYLGSIYDNGFSGRTRSGEPWGNPTGLEGLCREEDFPFIPYMLGAGVTPPAILVEAAKSAPRITFRRYGLVYPYNYWETVNRIKRAIYRYGAVAGNILNCSAFRAYKSGVYEDTRIYPNKLPYPVSATNHAIALVGWDDNPPEGGNGCWILRNSWGESWGERGYMRIRYFSAGVNYRNEYLEAESADDGNLKIYGQVSVDGAAGSWISVLLSGDDSFESIATGGWHGFSALKAGHYRVTPDQPGVLFTPPYQEVNLTTGYAVVNFAGKSAFAG